MYGVSMVAAMLEGWIVTERVVMFSGGPDSLCGWFLSKQPQALYVDFGHRYAMKELRVVMDLIPNVEVSQSFNGYGKKWERIDAHIPARNLLLALEGANYADEVLICVEKGTEREPDRDQDFFAEASVTLTHLMGRRIDVINPISHWTKNEVVREYLRR